MQTNSVFAYSALMSGRWVPLSYYSSNVIIIVNTASLCSFSTSNLNLLMQVQAKYKTNTQGVNILAFPCSQFANQEPKSNEEIITWATQAGVNFTLFDKVKVKGKEAHPLFQMLQATLGPIRWNYTKFICDREGIPRIKLSPNCSREELENAIEQFI